MISPNMSDYEAARRDTKLDVPEFFNFTCDVFEQRCRETPGRTALIVGSADGNSFEKFSFDDLRRKANQFCHVLRGLGVKKGDRVLMLLGWGHEWYVAVLGMIKLGVIPVPTTTQSRPRDLVYRFELSGAVAAICSDETCGVLDEVASQCPTLRHKLLVGSAPRDGWINFAAALAEEPDEIDAVEKTRSDDPMLIYFTSGTVAYPKMVLHTQASFGIGHILTAKFWHDLKPEDVHWTLTDTGWAKAAWGCLFGQWQIGCTIFVSRAAKFEPQKTLATLGKVGITTFCAPPTVYRVLVRENLKAFNLTSLRHCTSAGEPLNPEVIRIWLDATGSMIYDGYGQTETVNLLANFRCNPIKPGSMGKPVPTFDVAIVDDDGVEQPPGNEGHVAVRVKPNRPVGFFREYLHASDTMSAAFRGDWYYTGDRAYRDSDGYFWFVGRADDVIITSGYRIGPFEVENALIEHPAVKESAVVSSPNELRGEIVKAFVVLAPGHEGTPALVHELQQHVRNITAPYKYPRAIEFVKELPKTVSGKIKRGELRRREWAGWRGGMKKLRKRRRYRRTYRRLGLLGLLERLRRSWFTGGTTAKN
jgi:acyl-coenzyme A synthetase/AMP-(fatty) acid ligase